MVLMDWDESLSVNVKEMDEQHIKLLDMLGVLHESMMMGWSGEATPEIIEELEDYATTHFKAEEQYFEAFGFKGALEHQAEHKKFFEKITSFKREHDAGNIDMAQEISAFLKNWIITHIKGTDKKYTKCFNDNGLV